ncbi:MAG: hybrid sensor histidine kinase/response regulator, partial [Lachnospiraceae bacterium]|nr:hybrid sensor histidine kinase/response regulator [Lachnospiraceae bacterium]
MDQSKHIGINEKQRRQTAVYAIVGGSIIVSILLITSIWVSNMARIGTSQAVSKVSEFYLEELAGRRAQVVSEELKNGFAYIESSLEILDESDLESQEALRAFLGKVKKLHGVDKFALVDENGNVYTEHSTSSGLSRYDFLSEDLTEPVIGTTNLHGAKKQVILAVPVENVYFQGLQIKVCFIQINIDEMISSLSLQTGNNETYCGLYYRNGESLTNEDFGNFKSEN